MLGWTAGGRTNAAGVQRSHVEDVHALHLAQDLQALETGGLLEVGGDGAGRSARREKVIVAGDLCMRVVWSATGVQGIESAADVRWCGCGWTHAQTAS